jgi:hypothetical protein
MQADLEETQQEQLSNIIENDFGITVDDVTNDIDATANPD